MAVGFILGRSGTGKTSFCIEAISAGLLDGGEKRPLVFLVPEQATYQAEKAILTSGKIEAFTNLSVLSFSRLQFLLLGRNSAKTELSNLGRELVLSRILRASAKELKVFGSCAAYPGMASRIAQTIIELHQCGHTPEDMEKLYGEVDGAAPGSLTACKFHDVSYIYRRYTEAIAGKFINPDIQLTLACEAVKGSHLLCGAAVWVDGFSGFTPQELAILGEIFKAADTCRVALCLDPSTTDLGVTDAAQLDETDLFSPTQRTYAALNKIVKSNGIGLLEPVILNKQRRFARAAELGHVEKNIFAAQPDRIENKGAITIAAAANMRSEAIWAAKQIRSLVRQNGWRWRDVAIVASDLNSYRHYIGPALDDCLIPHFIDISRPLGRHPVAELLISALGVIAGGYKSCDVLAFLKTDLTPCGRGEIDFFENYVLALGIEGADYKSAKWNGAEIGKTKVDVEKIERVRNAALGPVISLEEKLAAATNLSAAAFGTILFEFLGELKADARVSEWIAQAQHSGDHARADEHAQFIGQFKNIFTEMIEVFEEDTFTAAQLSALLGRAFEQLSLRLIPPSLDQVLVGSIERSRHPDLKAVFLLGATQKAFPAGLSHDTILTDSDRQAAFDAGHQLGDSITAQLCQRQYLAYIAFTRPRARLFISYPLNDEKGSSITHSPFISDLQELFTNLKPYLCGAGDEGLEPAGVSQLKDTLCMQLGRDCDNYPAAADRGVLAAAKNAMHGEAALAGAAQMVSKVLAYENEARLDEGCAAELYRDMRRISHTRTSTFASCPYKHFAKYGLSLRSREVSRFEAMDLGDFYHQVLDRLFKQTRADFSTLDRDCLKGQLNAAVEYVMSSQARFSNFAARNVLNQAIFRYGIDLLEDLLGELQKLSLAGKFRQAGSEVSFGIGKNPELPAIGIKLDSGEVVYFTGKIDRLDISDDEPCAAIVYDFKSRGQSPDWCNMYYGIDLQLVSYVLAVNGRCFGGKGPIKAVGTFYIPIDPATQSSDYDSFDEVSRFRRKAKGVFDGDFATALDKNVSGFSQFFNFSYSKDGSPYSNFEISGAVEPARFEGVIDFAVKKIKAITSSILRGSIDISPYRLRDVSPCSRCDYKSLCRFDWHINDYNHLAPVSKSGFLEKIGSEAV